MYPCIDLWASKSKNVSSYKVTQDIGVLIAIHTNFTTHTYIDKTSLRSFYTTEWKYVVCIQLDKQKFKIKIWYTKTYTACFLLPCLFLLHSMLKPF